MRILAMREPLPDRRRSRTQRVRIGGQTCYLCVGEYDDGRPGEIFVDIAKQGTFLRGVMAALARTVSIALQCGADIETIIYSLKGGTYPPSGYVEGSANVKEVTSVTDWIAAELEAMYLGHPLQPAPTISMIDPDGDEDEGDDDEVDDEPESVGVSYSNHSSSRS